MTEAIHQRLSAEGADPLLLAGVHDANLLELQRSTGVKATLRGDTLILGGTAEQVELATPAVRAMIDRARVGEPVEPDDVVRFVAEEGPPDVADLAELKIVLPGVRKAIVPKTQGQREYLKAIEENDIVVAVGPAGTGKTYLAVAKALEALARKRVRRIILARPAVEAGESLGFLPGDLQAKVDPYLRPLYDALEDMMPYEKMQRALESNVIEIAPLAFMRGRTLSDAFIILDEAQNSTGLQMKMFLTRLGVNSKTVVTGDKTQIDLPQHEESGLVQVERILANVEGVAVRYLHDVDVVRHRLVREIIRAYAEDQSG
ncbi:MAG: PhoH family protein [Planctomycetota bacterium]|nr:MAG: PhoH family protein [Planctomycetota bacterium]